MAYLENGLECEFNSIFELSLQEIEPDSYCRLKSLKLDLINADILVKMWRFQAVFLSETDKKCATFLPKHLPGSDVSV